MKNIDKKTVDGFGEEWSKYNQSSIPDDELEKTWNQYFDMFSFYVVISLITQFQFSKIFFGHSSITTTKPALLPKLAASS